MVTTSLAAPLNQGPSRICSAASSGASTARSVRRLTFPPAVHRLVDAGNARQAIDLLDPLQPFDAIVLDLRMPEMNGVEFIHALRQLPLIGRPRSWWSAVRGGTGARPSGAPARRRGDREEAMEAAGAC